MSTDSTWVEGQTRPLTLIQGWHTLPTINALREGLVLGPYVLREKLGEGGMGVVWRAEQTSPVRRDVALKLAQRKFQSGVAEAYFQIERQALAQMNHPAIAGIYDAGTMPDGALFFAMEYIEGKTLDQYLHDDRPALKTIVRLIVQVCRGIQHAHQRGMLHRDLKPTNILIRALEDAPAAKIIDFGVAIGIDPTRLTAHAEDAVGTRAYMAPEQGDMRHGSLDARVDVYALGAVLAECLLGHAGIATKPGDLTSQSMRSALSHSLGDEPIGDSSAIDQVTALRKIPADLRAIARKAMRENREQRYDSAGALGDDLNRFLRHFPVEAVGAGPTYRMRCFVRRHRVISLAAVAVLVALLAGFATALYGLKAARDGQALAQIEADRAQQTATFLSTVLSSVDPSRAKDLDRTLMREVLDQAAQRSSATLVGSNDVRYSIALTIADTYRALGEYDLAKTQLELAKTLATTPRAAFDVEKRFVATLGDTNDSAKAVERGQRLLDQMTDILGQEDSDTLRMRSTLQWYTVTAGKLKEAASMFPGLREQLLQRFGEHSEVVNFQRHTDAVIASTQGDYAVAEQLYKSLISSYLQELGPDHTKTQSSQQSLSILYLESGRPAEAAEILRPLQATLLRRNGPDHPATINTTMALAGAIRKSGHIKESQPYYQANLDATYRVYGVEHPVSIYARLNYANFELADNQAEACVARLLALLPDATRVLGDKHPAIEDLYATLSRAYAAQDDTLKAISASEQALAMAKLVYGEDHPKTRSNTEALAALRKALRP